MLVAVQQKLRRRAMLQLLHEIEASRDIGFAIYLPTGSSEHEVESTLSIVLNDKDIFKDVCGLITKSRTGAVLFWGKYHKYLVLPPFSIAEQVILQNCVTEQLCALLNKDLTIALILVRLGSYAVGVFQGEVMLSSKVGTGLVHARHKKGGSSAHRFERHRDKQIEYFFGRVCAHLQEKLDPIREQIDYLYYGGENFTIRAFRQQCSFLEIFDDRTADILLNIREPKQATLETAIYEVWASKVITWQEN